MAKKRPHFDLPKPEIIMEGVTPDAAIEFWQWRAKLTDEEAKALGEGARCRAFYVSGLARHDLVMLVSDGMEEALKNGETLETFKARIAEAIRTQGWHDYRVENIFRTNMQTAYAAGRYKKMQAVKKSRPYWQYMAIMDRRVRPSHAILNGMVYPADHEFWKTNYPPNGFRCRCGVRSLSARQVKRMGLEVRKDMPGPGVWTDPKTEYEYFVHFPGADKGFKNNPGRDWVSDLRDLAVKRLETAPPKLAAASVRSLVQGGFAYFMEHPRGNFPLAVLKREDATKIGGKGQVAVISAQTMLKQKDHHPELTVKDYALAQDAVERGERILDGERNMIFVIDESEGVTVVVKATRMGDEMYVTSLRRMSRDEAEREHTMRKLRNKGKK